jgi:small subunit ribosomal protein S6
VTQATSAAPPGAPQKRQHAREYETIYILRSDVDAEAAERVQARVSDALGREQGKLVKVEAWGRRKLAYPLGKQRRGVYVYLKYVGGGGLVAEVERNLKLQDAVIKFMTVQSADDVDIEALTIDPEETTLGKFELPPEDEKEESREKQLGLIDLGPEAPRAPRPIEDFEGEDPEDGDERPAAAAPAAPVGGAAKPESEEET